MTAQRALGQRGFSLVEVLVALGILAFALTGALGGFIAVSKNLASSQVQSYRAVLLDASVQRWALANKTAIGPLAALAKPISNCPGSTTPPDCSQVPIGTGPWVADPTVIQTGDFSSGAYFTITPAGGIVQLTGSFTGCTDTALPAGAYCRELLVTQGNAPITSQSLRNWSATWPPTTPTMLVGINPTIYTLWIRVSKVGDTVGNAYTYSTSFLPSS